MDNEPIEDLVKELGAKLSQKEHIDIVQSSGGGEKFDIIPSNFREITKTNTLRKIAFVDGGNGILNEKPNFLINLNRTYFSIFKGEERIDSKSKSRIEFLSFVISNVHTDDEKITYNTRIFPQNNKDSVFPQNNKDSIYLPLEADLTLQEDASDVMPVQKLGLLARKFAEWQMAIHVIENELESGDMIVMDGTLQTSYKNEVKYTKKLYEVAMRKNVTVCGLSKTSRLVTKSGESLITRISEIAKDVPFRKWYIKIAEKISNQDQGFTLAVKLHEESSHIFRFEILQEQFKEMSLDDINSILYSLAENSRDISMLGYPYGAIDADRFAQIRENDLVMYRGLLLAMFDKNPKLGKNYNPLDVHDTLNKVTS